ncbi:MAG: CpXC domain-containing protein [Paracoccaceae bacterium]
MSLSEIRDCPCPECAAIAPVEFFASVDADLRTDILTGQLQRVTCPACKAVYRPEPGLTYLDAQAGLWISARPADALARWDHEEAAAGAAFDESYGPSAPDIAQEIGTGLHPRLTFGWPALREKLMIADQGLNDVTVEMLKLSVLRNRPGNPAGQGIELRLLDVRGPVLELGWLTSAGAEVLDVFQAQRRLYDSIATDPAWQAMAAKLPERGFVDLQRLVISSRPDTA